MNWQRKEYRPGRVQMKLETPLVTILITQADGGGWLLCMGEYVEMVRWTHSEQGIKKFALEMLAARCTDIVQNVKTLLLVK
jgi:hypothetical protein